MSYEIVYNRQFLKIDDKIIPLVLYGSNNCTEISSRGRERRERSWHPMYFGRNETIAFSEQEILERVRSNFNGYEHFMRNGKWVDDAGLLRFFQNGVKEAKTIEELQETYFFNGLFGYFSVWGRSGNHVEHRKEIRSSDDLREYLKDAEKRLDERTDSDGDIFICLSYYDEKFSRREKRESKPKERLTDFYALQVQNIGNSIGYLEKVTKTKLLYSPLGSRTKQFRTEKEAVRYKEKLDGRIKGSIDFSVEHIVS